MNKHKTPWWTKAYNKALDLGIDALQSRPGTVLRGLGTGIVNSLATTAGLAGTAMKTVGNAGYDALSTGADLIGASGVSRWAKDRRNENTTGWDRINKSVYRYAGDLYSDNKQGTDSSNKKLFEMSTSTGELVPDLLIPTAVGVKALKYLPKFRTVTRAANLGKIVNSIPKAPRALKTYANWISTHPKLAATGAVVSAGIPMLDAATGFSHITESDPTWRKAIAAAGKGAQATATVANPIAGFASIPLALPALREGAADATGQLSASWLPRVLNFDRAQGVIGPVKDQLLSTMSEENRKALKDWWNSPTDYSNIKAIGGRAARYLGRELLAEPGKYTENVLGVLTKPAETLWQWAKDRAHELPSSLPLRLTGLQDITKPTSPAAKVKQLMKKSAPADERGQLFSGFSSALSSLRNRERFIGTDNMAAYNEALNLKAALESERTKLQNASNKTQRLGEALLTPDINPALRPYRDAVVAGNIPEKHRALAYKLLRSKYKLADEWSKLSPEARGLISWGGSQLLRELASRVIRNNR